MRRLITDAEFIRDRITIAPSGCWEWLRYRNKDGYAVTTRAGRQARAHRLSYETFVGPIPEGLTIDHLCKNRGCVNPAHMEPVPLRENILRGASPFAEKARRTHCTHGHPFDEENTYFNKRGHRVCRACRREASRLAGERARRAKGQKPYDPDHCKNGHPWTEESTRYVKTGRSCKICEAEYQRRRRGTPKPAGKLKPTHCPRGHAYTPENSYVTPAGYRYCRECNREASRRRWERTRSAA